MRLKTISLSYISRILFKSSRSRLFKLVFLFININFVSCGGLNAKFEKTILQSNDNNCPVPTTQPSPPATPSPTSSPPQFVAISYGRNIDFNTLPSLNLNLPIGVTDGDLLIMMVGSDNRAEWNKPTGWIPLYADAYPNADGANFNTYYRFASGEPTSYTVTATPYTASAAGWIAAWRGVDTNIPFISQSHDTFYQTDNVTTKTLITSSISTNVDNGKIVFIGYVDQNTVATMNFTAPTGFTVLGTQQDANNWVTSIISEKTMTTAGSTGSLSAIWDNGNTNSSITSGVGAIALALRPK